MIVDEAKIMELVQNPNGGQCIGGYHIEDGKVVNSPLDGNAIFILADRYLAPGPETEEIIGMDVDWSGWPLEYRFPVLVPMHWTLMSKGVLRNWFRWYEPRKDELKKAFWDR